MAWERSFEAKVLKVREKELRYQKLNYTIEVRVKELIVFGGRETDLTSLGIMECHLVCFASCADWTYI